MECWASARHLAACSVAKAFGRLLVFGGKLAECSVANPANFHSNVLVNSGSVMMVAWMPTAEILNL
jgi:hypothetical protein